MGSVSIVKLRDLLLVYGTCLIEVRHVGLCKPKSMRKEAFTSRGVIMVVVYLSETEIVLTTLKMSV